MLAVNPSPTPAAAHRSIKDKKKLCSVYPQPSRIFTLLDILLFFTFVSFVTRGLRAVISTYLVIHSTRDQTCIF